MRPYNSFQPSPQPPIHLNLSLSLMSKFTVRRALVGAALLALAALPARAQTFPFALPWDDGAPTPTSLADLNPAPLTGTHRIQVSGGHFVDQTGRRVRLLGTNVGSSAAFTRPEDAGAVAARLHKYGFNIVRLHHIDAAWSNPSIFGADHDARKGPNQKVDADSLELLDNFVAQLKKQGVYTNLNLHVSRTPSPGDGFPDADKLPELGKVVAYFEPKFIALQKDYARQILDHVNPHTGLRWADDPAIAVVEINNEDTLIGHAWDGSLQAMPPFYRDTLVKGWNTFLKARYRDDAALKNAWQGEPIGDNIMRDVALSENTAQWTLVRQDVAEGALESVENVEGVEKALKVNVTKKPAQDWQMEVVQTKLGLREGQYYTASLRARSDAPRAISVSVGINQAPWTRYGGPVTLKLTPDWQKFSFVFRAGGVAPDTNRFIVAVGASTEPVYLADVQIRPGVLADIAPNWSLERANFDLPASSVVPTQAQDWTDYLGAVEKSYVDSMTDYLKNELGYQGLVTCSQASYGGWAGVARESRTDFIDMHAYWQHPRFPGKAWAPTNWNFPNTPMTDDAGTGTLLGLAAHRVAGKPFTVSEYNHSAPGDYASEAVPLILGYAAAQDWDGVYLFAYNGSRDNWKTDKIPNYFDIHSDPNKMALLPGMARAFLRGDVAALRATTTLTVPRDRLLEWTAQKRSANVYDGAVANDWRKWGLTRADLLESRVQLKLASTGTDPKLERQGPRGGAQWSWTFRGDRGLVEIDAPDAKAFVGRVADSFVVGPLEAGALRISQVGSSNGWASLSLVALDKAPIAQSKSLLLTAINRAENKGMGWNETRTSVGDKWGEGPTQIAVPSANIEVKTNAKRARVFRLTPTGARGKIQSSTLKDGVLSFSIGPNDETVWWQIVTE